MDGGAEREPARYRPLLVGSLALIVAGVAVIGSVLVFARGTLTDVLADGAADRAVVVLAGLFVGGMALLVGLLAHAARSIVVRAVLPPHRYRGPSILVMLVIAVIAANLAIVPAAGQVAALLGGDELSPLGTLAILTVTQVSLLGVAALYVVAPRALVGLRLRPERGLWRSVGLGLALALPAWIGAQLIGLIVIRLLDLVGLEPDVGVAEQALANADPVILVFAIVVVAPIAEELFFRGVVLNAWLREYGPRVAILGSGLLFAMIHASLFLFLPIAALGIALALLYRATGSLPATIALHAGFNGITVLIGLLARYGVLDLPVT
ncbi:MAG TPA: type II CAAX endopeptidase family protein [Candidatus Limnocylindria bacterium]